MSLPMTVCPSHMSLYAGPHMWLDFPGWDKGRTDTLLLRRTRGLMTPRGPSVPLLPSWKDTVSLSVGPRDGKYSEQSRSTDLKLSGFRSSAP